MEQLTANGRFICTNTGDKIIQCSNSGQALLLTRAYNGTTAQGIYPDKVKEMYESLEKMVDLVEKNEKRNLADIRTLTYKAKELLQSAKIK